MKKALLGVVILGMIISCSETTTKEVKNETEKKKVEKTESKQETKVKANTTKKTVVAPIIVKNIGGELITESFLEKEVDKLPKERRDYYKSGKGREELISRLTEMKLLKLVALEQGLDKTDEYTYEVELQIDRVLAELAYKKNVLEKDIITEEEYKAEYEAKKDKFKKDAQVNASHILVKVLDNSSDEEKETAKKKAEDILKEVKEGGDFTKIAMEKSEGPSSKTGGKLGWFGKGQMVKPFEEASFKGEIGVYPELVQTQFGYHIIKIEEKREAGFLSLEEAKPELERDLKTKKIRGYYEKFMADLKTKYNVK